LIDALVEEGAGPVEADAVDGGSGAVEGGAQRRLGLAGEEAYFEGAFDVAGILQRHVAGGKRVEGEELGDLLFEGEGGEEGAKLRIAARERIEAVSEGLQVEAGASDNDGDLVAGVDAVKERKREIAEALGVARFIGVEDVEQVVGDESAFGGAGFGGQDVESAVELEGVGIDDFTADVAGQCEGGRAFAGGGGADDKEGAGGDGLEWGHAGQRQKSPSHDQA